MDEVLLVHSADCRSLPDLNQQAPLVQVLNKDWAQPLSVLKRPMVKLLLNWLTSVEKQALVSALVVLVFAIDWMTVPLLVLLVLLVNQ